MRDWLKKSRKEKGLTQKEVAAQSFINRAFYSQIENGSRNPSMEVAKSIAKVLGFNASAFFTEELSEPFQAAIKNSPMVLAHCDLDLRYTWIFNLPPDFDPEETIGKKDNELIMGQGSVDLMVLKQKVLDEGVKRKQKITIPLSDGIHTYFVFAQPLLNENLEIIGAATVSMDISDFLNNFDGIHHFDNDSHYKSS